MKEAKSNTVNNIDDIENDIEYVLENVACLGKAARGVYNERMKQFLVLSIQKVMMQERVKAQQEWNAIINDARELLEEYTQQDKWQSGDKVIRVINILRNMQK